MTSTKYAPFYCEENVWWLARNAFVADVPAEVVFVTNAARTVALWSQRASPSNAEPVIWDYHAVLARPSPSGGISVLDPDCTLPSPIPAKTWVDATFPPNMSIPPDLQPRFRVLSSDAYLETFSSDRSHMRAEDGSWKQPPPPWDPIGRHAPNLARFLDLDDAFVGDVLDLDELRARWRI